ncbi:MAG: CYTH domain-containing protein [Gammaproteobacteria bacterium CG11_big_fil_rev_8_21_14_0_20_46_22]|nr:MAG: CYTH domain-containing protein [Gammaproteobacteria bacterium CG12_big_fil_rev_8_21_14_0_65_46_12]PIR11036.1 MAG: CYTH domain-containing protein [Gammaproteobacteria bacterium CG11_big_fil_rev_8_21_14_0_20_46_22]
MSEVELKLNMDERDVQKLINILAREHKELHLYSVYYDTSDRVLSEHGYALRLRQSGQQLIQTLKGGGSVENGLHRRDEWEWEVGRHGIDYPLLEDKLGELYPKIHKQLEPLFETEFIRTQWDIENAFGAVELAFDHGEVRGQCGAERLCELELELKDGDEKALHELFAFLDKQLSLSPNNVSKAERGYLLSEFGFE